uniref:EOG090X0FJX n=1 Tax=Simocephalus serrulatus TaxID=117539 RepID=A0A4Y7NPJ2_9CRUS|nr:EOG090X0FJX [Simocephalus serrulatus]SVE94556.1 EOG090X0FJX [Simocephalus serrulatus]
MNPDDFELETKLRSLSISQESGSTNNEREHELAELIANCVADVEPRDVQSEEEQKELSGETKENELPTSLIVTNLPQELFFQQELKTELEALFRTFDDTATFHYLRSFRRARVDFANNSIASKARVHLHHTPFGESVMNCFFGQAPFVNKNSHQFLQIPPPVRQFLISPPASPPVDWAPGPETEPVVNFDLLSAIASLGPGDKHELLPATENQPGIVVHVCADMEGGPRQRVITQTPCPKRN